MAAWQQGEDEYVRNKDNSLEEGEDGDEEDEFQGAREMGERQC